MVVDEAGVVDYTSPAIERVLGYEQIGANTWRCTRCGCVLADNDPDNYKIG